MADLGEVLLEPVQERPFRPTTQDLGHEGAARLQHLSGEVVRRLGQSHDAQVIGLGITRGRSRHVAQYDIGGSLQQFGENLGRVVVVEILGQHGRPGDRLDRRQVDADDRPGGSPGFGPLDGDLGPPAGGGTKVDDACTRLQEAELIVDLQQLEGGTRPVASLLGLGDVGIVELTLQPALRGDRTAPRRLHPDGGPSAGRQASGRPPTLDVPCHSVSRPAGRADRRRGRPGA